MRTIEQWNAKEQADAEEANRNRPKGPFPPRVPPPLKPLGVVCPSCGGELHLDPDRFWFGAVGYDDYVICPQCQQVGRMQMQNYSVGRKITMKP